MELVLCLLVILHLVNVHSVEVNYLLYSSKDRHAPFASSGSWNRQMICSAAPWISDLSSCSSSSHSSSLLGILTTCLWVDQLRVSRNTRIERRRSTSDHASRSLILSSSFWRFASTWLEHRESMLSEKCVRVERYTFWSPSAETLSNTSLAVGHSYGSSLCKRLKSADCLEDLLDALHDVCIIFLQGLAQHWWRLQHNYIHGTSNKHFSPSPLLKISLQPCSIHRCDCAIWVSHHSN